jgi:hypothetical protein
MEKYSRLPKILALIKVNITLKIKNKKKIKIKRMSNNKKIRKYHIHRLVVKLGLNMELILLQKKMKAHLQ